MIVVICLSRIARVELSFVTVIARVAGFAEVERARRVRGWSSGATSAAGASEPASAASAPAVSVSAAGASAPASAAGAAPASDSDEAVAPSCEDTTSVACVLSSAALARQARGVSDVTRSERAAKLAAPATPTRARNGRSRDIDFSFD